MAGVRCGFWAPFLQYCHYSIFHWPAHWLLSLQLWRSFWASWASFMLGCPPPRNTTDKRLGKKTPRKYIRMHHYSEMPSSAIWLIGHQFVPLRDTHNREIRRGSLVAL